MVPLTPVATAGTPAQTPFSFGRIVCAVNGSRGSQEAVNQAIRLVGPDDALTFVAVTDGQGTGLVAQASLDAEHAEQAVGAAHAAARADGVDSSTRVIFARDIAAGILEAARDACLLVIGPHGQSRPAGILLGGATSRAVHRSTKPVLIARTRPELRFPGIVLVATQGDEDREAAVVAATIAALHATRVVLAHAGPSDPVLRLELIAQAAEVHEIVGREPVIVSVEGPPVNRLVDMASSIGAGMLVLGSHGRRGPQALASVSERIAHSAGCSVLVLRPPVSRGARG